MSKLIQIRHVPDALHRRLRSLAALAGLTLSDYLTLELERVAERPTLTELRQHLAALTLAVVNEPPSQVVRRERGDR